MSRDDLSYIGRVLALALLPLTFDREVKDLVFLYNALFDYLNFDFIIYVSFVSNGWTRLSILLKYILQSQIGRSSTFQSSYYNRVVIVWALYVQTYVLTVCLVLILLHPKLYVDTLW